jgi:hypothetical protein
MTISARNLLQISLIESGKRLRSIGYMLLMLVLRRSRKRIGKRFAINTRKNTLF